MSTTLRIAFAGIAFATILGPVHTTAATDSSAPAVQFVGLSSTERDMAEHAIELFTEAGLELPPVTIRHHDDTTACDGKDGLHRNAGDRSEIDLCLDGPWVAHTVLHELSHAWAFHSMTPAQRDAFQAVRGWNYWLDYHHAAWKDNGAEQAAEIMVWALSDTPTPIVQIADHSCTDLHAAYVALTGQEPLHGLTRSCADTPTKTQVA